MKNEKRNPDWTIILFTVVLITLTPGLKPGVLPDMLAQLVPSAIGDLSRK